MAIVREFRSLPSYVNQGMGFTSEYLILKHVLKSKPILDFCRSLYVPKMTSGNYYQNHYFRPSKSHCFAFFLRYYVQRESRIE